MIESPGPNALEKGVAIASNVAYVALCGGVLLTLFPGVRHELARAAESQLYYWRRGLRSLRPLEGWERELRQVRGASDS